MTVLLREDERRKAKPTLGLIDAQSVKNASCAGEKGYDAGKKTGGIKRHIVVDTMGLLHGFLVTTADETDRNGAIEMVGLHLDGLSRVRKFVVDGGYSGENFAAAIRGLTGAEVQVVKRSEVGKFVVLPQRWIVERSFGWLNHARRLWKNCERALHNSCQMMVLAFIPVYLRRF